MAGIGAEHAHRQKHRTGQLDPHLSGEARFHGDARANATRPRDERQAAPVCRTQARGAQPALGFSFGARRGALDPAEKRLAVRVEDHPLDYAEFEGTIPEGQYGAGTVEIWDRGRWTPEGDPEDGLRRSELKFELNGQRLTGGFVPVRLRPRERDRGENWLLIKEHDQYVRAGASAEVIEREGTHQATTAPKPVATTHGASGQRGTSTRSARGRTTA
jgi:hypothetical protein